MKILFTSVGRRVELIQEFIKARDKLDMGTQIIGGDISDTAPALYFSDDNITLKPIRDPNYIKSLIQICSERKIDALIPTIDTDLLMLSEAKQDFAKIGTTVLITDPQQIRICRDKRKTAQFLLECGLKTPVPVDNVNNYSAGFPCFIKPLDGSSSIDAFKIENQESLNAQAARMNNYIIQPFIDGTEYTVDIFCDFNGEPLAITPRVRISTRSGEVMKTRICNDQKIIAECQSLLRHFNAVGAITVQLIRENKTGDDFYIEINPRYGGGAPLSMKAGANSAELLLQLLAKRKVERCVAREGLSYSRFDQSICINETRTYKAIVFDLDDTLYSEKDYVKSGFSAIETYLRVNGYSPETGALWTLFSERAQYPIDLLLQNMGIYSAQLRDGCLNEYRNHRPDIKLYDGLQEAIAELKQRGIATALLTDGRPEGQNAKIDALGIRNLFDEIVITDELGGNHCRKPCDVGFRFLQKRLNVPFEQMLYVGDNATKDFIAPNNLGMGILFFSNPAGLYYRQNNGDISSAEELIQALYAMIE